MMAMTKIPEEALQDKYSSGYFTAGRAGTLDRNNPLPLAGGLFFVRAGGEGIRDLHIKQCV